MAEAPAALEQLRYEVAKANAALRSEVLRLCPEHDPLQHRDAKPAWCGLCGRDWAGVQQRDRPSPIGFRQ